MERSGLLVVISAPSGGGKTTILRRVFASGNGNFAYSISATTRARRPVEIDGRDYLFMSLEEFNQKRASGEFVESAEVHGHYYATPRRPLQKWLEQGKLVFLDLDVDGGLEVKRQFGDKSLLIFIKPPSFESLVERLNLRDTETPAEIDKRMQRYPKEMAKSKDYDYCIVNSDIEVTVSEVIGLIRQHYCLS